MVFFISNTVKATITAAVGGLFFLTTQEMVDNLLKNEYFHQKNYFIFIIYAQIYLKNFRPFDAIRFFFKFTKITFFQAVKLVVPLNVYNVSTHQRFFQTNLSIFIKDIVFLYIFFLFIIFFFTIFCYTFYLHT